jgi:hypothetical protein
MGLKERSDHGSPPIGLPLGRPKLIKKNQKHHNDLLLSSFHLARFVYPNISRSIFEGCFAFINCHPTDDDDGTTAMIFQAGKQATTIQYF